MAASDRPYRVGIVGAGDISKLHLQAIGRHPDRMQVVALHDPKEEALKARAAGRANMATYTDLGDMIARAALDVAVVCTPTHVRKDVILPLVEARTPVFCEKPFAETYAEAAEIEREARGADVPVAINQNFRRRQPEIHADHGGGLPVPRTEPVRLRGRDRMKSARRRHGPQRDGLGPEFCRPGY